VVFAVGLILLLVFIYLRRRRRIRQMALQSPPRRLSGQRTRRSREGVWRPEVIVGLPGYTKEPSRGELTLVGGKKISNEYELHAIERSNLERVQTWSSQVRTVEEGNIAEACSVEDGGDTAGSETRPPAMQRIPPAESSPPYLPSPDRAVVRNRE
jgi:hypothetical protein